ncbi:MAG: WYL domain-containing protein [Clostridia bacterium]|nr:WYL domain-containing protein [Clostridia bacterium]
MPRGANQKIKILYLMRILLERTDDAHGLTTEELIAALHDLGVDAERKTIYDDIETLRLFGLDIETRRGKKTTYHIVSRDFELPELKLLVDAVQSSKFITHKKSSELIKKLANFASRYEAQQLQRNVVVHNRIKTMNESIYYFVDSIHEAIGKNVKITFQYFTWNEKKQKVLRHHGKLYEISPWALTWDDENYYLIGFDSPAGTIKHFRVDKMQKIQLTDKKRDGEAHFKNFDLGAYSKKTFGMYGGQEATVTLRCKNHLAGVMLDRFGQDVIFRIVDEEYFEFHVKVQTSPLFYAWVLNFGDDVKITAPLDVQEALVERLQKVLSLYPNNPC